MKSKRRSFHQSIMLIIKKIKYLFGGKAAPWKSIIDWGYMPEETVFDVQVRLKDGYYGVTVCKSPHGNCQIFSVLNFRTLLCYRLTAMELHRVFHSLHDATNKKLVLLDLLDADFNEFLSLVDSDNIIFQSPYKNLTGSKMTMVLYQIR